MDKDATVKELYVRVMAFSMYGLNGRGRNAVLEIRGLCDKLLNLDPSFYRQWTCEWALQENEAQEKTIKRRHGNVVHADFRAGRVQV